jgi:hypothetical protein
MSNDKFPYMDNHTYKFPYKGSMTDGRISLSYQNRLVVRGINDAKGMYFLMEGNKVTNTYPSYKLAADACMCGGMDGWAVDEYEYNHPVTGGPPEYHAGISQKTQAPSKYPGATEADLHNSKAGIDEEQGELKPYNRQSEIHNDGGPGSGQKGHTTQHPSGHTRMTASHPSGVGKRMQAHVGSHQEAMQRLQSLRQHPDFAGHHVTLEHPSGRTFTVRAGRNEIPSHFFENQ